MEEVIKHINDTNSSYRNPKSGDAKNTDLFLDNEHYDYFKDSGEQITVRFNKENLSKAILFIASILPRKYDNSSIHQKIEYSSKFVYEQLALLDGYFMEDGIAVEFKTQIWNARKDVPQKNGKIDNRFYFNGLIEDFTYIDDKGKYQKAKFTIRNYLAGGFSNIHFKKSNDGVYDVTITNTQEAYYDEKDPIFDTDELEFTNRITETNTPYRPYFTAIRTKPFLLLAGISGTGKSRIVKDMAFQTCPNVGDLRSDNVSPGNYCLVEVKPNWHDSTELLGYDSVISGGYIVTKFVKFLVKAMLNDDIPFFVCLDEMNLAPVEQYFAEFLSVLESRKKEGEEITSEALIDASVFKKHEATLFAELFNKEIEKSSSYGVADLTEDYAHYGKEYEVYERLKQEGLRIPKNLIVIGTVNMDETTHQFSRKVIDRAMTIEMNIAEGEQPFKDFFASDSELKYYDNPLSANLFLPKNVTAKQAMDELDLAEQDKLKDLVPERLAAINNALDGTPFKIAYRVQNELLIYYCEMRRIDTETKTSELLNKAIDGILMMKVLPRVEGDRDLLEKPLEKLANICNDGYPEAYKKIKEMQGRLESAPFTSFWP